MVGCQFTICRIGVISVRGWRWSSVPRVKARILAGSSRDSVLLMHLTKIL
jgi:hypothetical protein